MLFAQNEPVGQRRRFPVYLVDATDGITPETGEAGGQPQVSKNGGAFVNTAGLLVAVGNGAYYVELTAVELDSLGSVTVRYKSAATAEFSVTATVVSPAFLAAGGANLVISPQIIFNQATEHFS